MNLEKLNELNENRDEIVSAIDTLRNNVADVSSELEAAKAKLATAELELTNLDAEIRSELSAAAEALSGVAHKVEAPKTSKRKPDAISKPAPVPGKSESVADADLMTIIKRNESVSFSDIMLRLVNDLLIQDGENRATKRNVAATVKSLVDQGKLVASGQKRGTRYTRA